MRIRSTTAAAFVALALAAGSCSGARPQNRPTAPFTPTLARYFDDSVDYVENVEGLGGRVFSEWRTQINGLARNSDMIGVGRIETVLLGTDVDGTRSYRLTAAIANVIRGEAPEENHVSLRVGEGQPGFNTVSGKEARLQAGRYIVFVRWYTDGAGQVQAHWHMTPYTEAIVRRVREANGIIDEGQGEERIVRQEGTHAPEIEEGDGGTQPPR